MAFADRLPLIQKIEELRGSKVICYLTSLRPGVPGQMAEDAIRELLDQLLALPERPIEKLDLFLCSHCRERNLVECPDGEEAIHPNFCDWSKGSAARGDSGS